MQTVAAYPTEVTLCISSNRQDRLRVVTERWGYSDVVCGWDEYLAHPYHLAHVHRQQMVAAAQNPGQLMVCHACMHLAIWRLNVPLSFFTRFACDGAALCACAAAYTAFMYLETDMLVSWESLLAWAADNALLEPLGFQRGFYRVEDDARTGQLGLTDQIEPLNINAWNETLYIKPSAGHQACDASATGPALCWCKKSQLRVTACMCRANTTCECLCHTAASG